MISVDARVENRHCHSATGHAERLNIRRAHQSRALGEGCVRNAIDVDRYHFGIAHQCLDRLGIRPGTKAAEPAILMANRETSTIHPPEYRASFCANMIGSSRPTRLASGISQYNGNADPVLGNRAIERIEQTAGSRIGHG